MSFDLDNVDWAALVNDEIEHDRAAERRVDRLADIQRREDAERRTMRAYTLWGLIGFCVLSFAVVAVAVLAGCAGYQPPGGGLTAAPCVVEGLCK